LVAPHATIVTCDSQALAANGLPLVYAITTEGAQLRHNRGMICSYADGHVGMLVKRQVGEDFAPYTLGMTGCAYVDCGNPDDYLIAAGTNDPNVAIKTALLKVIKGGATGAGDLTGSYSPTAKAWQFPVGTADAVHFQGLLKNDTPVHVRMEVVSDSDNSININAEGGSGPESARHNFLYLCNEDDLDAGSAGSVVWGDLGVEGSADYDYASTFLGKTDTLTKGIQPYRFTGGTIDLWLYHDPKVIVKDVDGDEMSYASIAMRGTLKTDQGEDFNYSGVVPITSGGLDNYGPMVAFSTGGFSIKKIWANW